MTSKRHTPKSHKNAFTGAKTISGTPDNKKTKTPRQPQSNGRSDAFKQRGRPASYTQDQKELAYSEYLAGDTSPEIARRLGCNPRTVRRWISDGGWEADLRARRETAQGLEAQILRLSRRKTLTQAQTQRLAVLTRSLERMKKAAPKPKPRPMVTNALHKDTLARVLDPEYGLYQYQTEFLQTEERFRIVLKARQIGFSYVVGLSVLLGAMAGRPQIVVSASERQAQIILGYVRQHAGRLDVVLEVDKSNIIKVLGTDIIATSTNFRTAQGWPGDVWFDEFAWVRQQRMLWAAIVPSITAVGGRVTVFSTPFLPGSHFWEIATNHKGKYDYFWRKTITIEDAIAQGMPLPGGVDELRMLFDSESWAMFYECQWAEDGAALLSWELLHALTERTIDANKFGRLRGGVDVGRINDRTAVALIGQEFARKKWFEKFALLHFESHKGLPFHHQKSVIQDVDSRFDVENWKVDKTGLGMQLAEELTTQSPERFEGVWFSAGRKQRLALNLLKLCEDKKLILPNDPAVLAQLHAVKKFTSGTSIKYDADRTEDGHADLFWAIALAADGRAKAGGGSGLGVEVLV